MSTTTTNTPTSAPAPEVTTPPAREPEPQEDTWGHDPEDAPADRTALLFWIIAFAILAFIVLCDLLTSLWR